MPNKVFNAFIKRLVKEAWLKSLICGLAVGFSAMGICSLALWIAGVDQFWISLIVFGAATIAAAAIFYFAKFKVSEAEAARRMDRLGLQERMITMIEFAGAVTDIARFQREDAISKANTVSPAMLAFTIPIRFIVAVCIAFVLGAGCLTVEILSAANIINSGGTIIDNILSEPPEQFELEYIEAEGGYIEGEFFQTVYEGENGTPVMAVAMDDYVFVGWSDGYTDPYREDLNVMGDIEVTAWFMVMQAGAGAGEGEGAGDNDERRPGEEGQEGQEGENGEQEGDNSQDTQGGGKYEETNQVIDGKTYYGNVFDDAYEEVLQRLAEDEDMPQYLKDMILRYFNTLKG